MCEAEGSVFTMLVMQLSQKAHGVKKSCSFRNSHWSNLAQTFDSKVHVRVYLASGLLPEHVVVAVGCFPEHLIVFLLERVSEVLERVADVQADWPVEAHLCRVA